MSRHYTVFSIIGRARRAARDADWPKDRLDAFTKKAMSGNYDQALQACMEYFDVDGVEQEEL